MFGLLGWLHALLFRGVLWLLKLPLKALLAFAVAVLALLGEEVRRWLGVLMAGLMILGVSWGLLKVAADQDRKSTRLNSSHLTQSRMPSSA